MNKETGFPSFAFDKETEGRRMVYSKDLKEYIEKHPGVMASVVGMVGELKDQEGGTKVLRGGISLTSVQVRSEKGDAKYPADATGVIYKLEFADEEKGSMEFCLKIERSYKHIEGGYQQAKSAKRAAELLQEHASKFPDIEIVPVHLGYTERKVGGHSYLITPWLNFKTLHEVGNYPFSSAKFPKEGISQELQHKLSTQFEDFLDLMGEKWFYDYGVHQTFIDVENGKLILFDITHNDYFREGLGLNAGE